LWSYIHIKQTHHTMCTSTIQTLWECNNHLPYIAIPHTNLWSIFFIVNHWLNNQYNPQFYDKNTLLNKHKKLHYRNVGGIYGTHCVGHATPTLETEHHHMYVVTHMPRNYRIWCW
jgi:hypothetical protein